MLNKKTYIIICVILIAAFLIYLCLSLFLPTLSDGVTVRAKYVPKDEIMVGGNVTPAPDSTKDDVSEGDSA